MMPTALLPFFHWLRLTRPWNVLAMGGMVWIVMRWLGSDLAALWHLGQSGWIVVPMLVGAAGNLINDYFDVREDRINKPNRALVGRLVKRRVVVVTHWGFTIAALCWSGWLASNADTSWPIVMVALFSVVLYVYSPMLKGNGALGNVAISICVGGLVIWAAMGSDALDSVDAWTFALLLAVLNFIREWVKGRARQSRRPSRTSQHHGHAIERNPKQAWLDRGHDPRSHSRHLLDSGHVCLGDLDRHVGGCGFGVRSASCGGQRTKPFSLAQSLDGIVVWGAFVTLQVVMGLRTH